MSPVDVTEAEPPIHRSKPGEVVAERALWGSRLLMFVGVAGSVLMAVIVLWMSAVDLGKPTRGSRPQPNQGAQP